MSSEKSEQKTPLQKLVDTVIGSTKPYYLNQPYFLLLDKFAEKSTLFLSGLFDEDTVSLILKNYKHITRIILLFTVFMHVILRRGNHSLTLFFHAIKPYTLLAN